MISDQKTACAQHRISNIEQKQKRQIFHDFCRFSLNATQIRQPMRFGLLVNGFYLQRWQYRAVQHLLEDGHELVVAIVRDNDPVADSIFNKLAHYPYNWLIYRIWQRFFFRPEAKRDVEISGILTGIPLIRCAPVRKKNTEWIPDKIADEVREIKTDFLLRLGFNIIRGSILDAPVYGIWSFHHDDEQLIRGGPPGFWEVFLGHDTNGIILQRLSAKLDAGPIIDKIWLPVIKHSYKAHLNMLLNESAYMPARACRSIALHGMRDKQPEALGKIYRNPNNLSMLRFMFMMPFRRIGLHLFQLLKQESWQVGVAAVSRDALLQMPDFSTLSLQWVRHPDRAQYYADPFVVDFQDLTIILAEHFSYHTGRGRLVRLLPDDGLRAVEVEMPDELHRSFPFLFVHQDKIYCLPECYASRTITLFEFNPSKNRLSNPVVLLNDVDALDPVLFEYNGYWWLMYSRKHLSGVQLYAWYADRPTGPFRPHPLNPLKTDPRCARNAGAPFLVEGRLIRPAQDIAGAYGKVVVLNRVEVLSPEDYLESPVQRFEPDSMWLFNKGLHTFNGNNTLVVMDAKTYRFSMAGLKHVWRTKTARKV